MGSSSASSLEKLRLDDLDGLFLKLRGQSMSLSREDVLDMSVFALLNFASKSSSRLLKLINCLMFSCNPAKEGRT